MHAGAIRAVGGEVDLDQRVVEAGPLGVSLADGRVVRQVDDALVVIGQFHLGFRDQHAAAFDAADGADAERDLLAGNVRAGRGEHALHAGARIRRAAHDLHRIARAGIDDADAQTVGVRMLLRLDHPRDGERSEGHRLVLDGLDLEPAHGELVGKLFQRLVGVEVFAQPGEGEFHRSVRSALLEKDENCQCSTLVRAERIELLDRAMS